MTRNRKDPGYIETNPDGGAQTIELWCYEEAEAEVDRLTDQLKLLRNRLESEGLCAISRLLHTQDNRITDQPMFLVEKKVRDYGYEDGFADDVVWLEEDGDSIPDLRERRLESAYQRTGKIPKKYRRCLFKDRWEFVTACFTKQGCQLYIKANGHNLGETRIYANGSYRNREFQSVRNFLMSLTAPPAANESKKAGS